MKYMNDDGLPNLDILRLLDKNLDRVLKTEINGKFPGLREVLKDYETQIKYLLEADDDESLPRLDGILIHHSQKLEKLHMSSFKLDLTAFNLDPIKCKENGVTQSDCGHTEKCYEDGTFVSGPLSYLIYECSIQEIFNIYEKFQLEAMEKIKERLIERAVEMIREKDEAAEGRQIGYVELGMSI